MATYVNFGTATSGLVFNFSAPPHGVIVQSTATAPRYVLIFDSATAPNVGDVPTAIVPVPQMYNGIPSLADVGNEFFNSAVYTNGIAWGWSTSPDTFQPATASEQRIEIEWGS